MNEILEDKELIKSLNQGLKEAKNGDYTLVWFSNSPNQRVWKKD
jgi:hypothetical protein